MINTHEVCKQLNIRHYQQRVGGARWERPAKWVDCHREYWSSYNFPKKSLCTRGVSYALYISLFISELFCTKGCMGGGGEESSSPSAHFIPLTTTPPKTYSTENRIQNTEDRIQKLIYIKFSIHLIWRLDFMILMPANPFSGPLEGVGPENRDLFGSRNGNERGLKK